MTKRTASNKPRAKKGAQDPGRDVTKDSGPKQKKAPASTATDGLRTEIKNVMNEELPGTVPPAGQPIPGSPQEDADEGPGVKLAKKIAKAESDAAGWKEELRELAEKGRAGTA